MLFPGDNIDIITVNSSLARPLQRSMPSTYFLMPSEQFWNDSETLIQTPSRNYTVKNYKQFFQDLNLNDGYQMRRDTEGLVDPSRPPNVVVHCLYGYGLPTAGGYLYGKGAWPDQPPKRFDGDGDRTVNIRSLRGCLNWKNKQKQGVYHKDFKGISHQKILSHSVVADYIKTILTN